MIQRAVRMQLHGLTTSGLKIPQKSSVRIDPFLTSKHRGNNQSIINVKRLRSHRVYSTNDSEPKESSFLQKSTEFLDGLLEKQKETLKKSEETDENLQLQLEAMRAGDAPSILIKVIQWLINVNASIRESEVRRIKELEEQREKLVAEWTEFEQKTENMDPIELDKIINQVATGEDASIQATSIVLSAFVTATLLSWGSTFFGINVATLLPDPSFPTASDLTTWAIWTLPYVGATAAASAILGHQWIGNRGTFRFLADDSFFANLHPTAVLSLSSALGYSQAVVYQAIWLLFFLKLYRGDTFSFLDPAAADEAAVQQAMGSLVATPKILVLLAGPAAVVSSAAVEAGYFFLKESINGVVQEVFNDSTTMIDPENGFKVIKKKEYVDPDGVECTDITAMFTIGPKTNELPKVPPKVPSLASQEMSTQDFWSTSGRVFLASLWMGAETLVTGNLWMAAGTGAVGMAVGMAARRTRARELGLGDD